MIGKPIGFRVSDRKTNQPIADPSIIKNPNKLSYN